MTSKSDAPRTEPTRGRNAHLLVACLGTVALCAISFAPQISVPKYRYAVFSLVPTLWVAYALRRRLALSPLHYALFAVALLLHDLGAFGWYSRHVAGLQFDWVIHFYFGMVGGLIVGRALNVQLGIRGFALALVSVLVVGGIGALHEIMEAGTNMLPGDNGMLYIGADNPYDSQEDMLAGTLGACTATLLRLTRRAARPHS